MLELEYIPLKTPDGGICGHARVRGGFVELSLRTPMRASALVITENGSADGAVNARIPVSAQVSAIALHEQDVMRCCGFSRTTALTPHDLRRRLQAMSPAKARAAESVLPPTRPPVKPPIQPPPEAPAPASFVEEIVAGIPGFGPGEKAAGKPASRAMPDPASREAVHARAARVYQRIDDAVPPVAYSPPVPPPSPAPKPPRSPKPQSTRVAGQTKPAPKTTKAPRPEPRNPWPPPPPEPPQGHQPPPPPEPPHGHQPPPPPEPPPREFSARPEPELRAADWARDAEAAPPATAPVSVPNPFPHIFPDAQFVRVSGEDALFGEWLHGNSRAEISAVPGPYSPQPPPNLTGYTRYIRARSGGYWVKVIDH